MKHPEVRQFCFCCTLVTGCQIIAWWEMIFTPLAFLYDLSFAVVVEYSPEDEEGYPSPPFHRSLMIVYYVEAIIQLITVVLGFFLAILLLIGLQRKKPVLLDFWVKYGTVIVIIRLLFLILYHIILPPIVWNYEISSVVAFLNVLLEIISTEIDVYFVIVVSSCRKEMSRRRIVPIPQDPEIHSTEIQYSRNEGSESPNNIVINRVPQKNYEQIPDKKGPDQIPLVEHEELQET